jgi:hypothetical protein
MGRLDPPKRIQPESTGQFDGHPVFREPAYIIHDTYGFELMSDEEMDALRSQAGAPLEVLEEV